MVKKLMARLLLPVALGIALGSSALAAAKPVFTSSDIEGHGADLIFCDLDGDGLQDAVLVQGSDLSVIYQQPKQGFARTPGPRFRVEDRAAILFPARLGQRFDSLMLLTTNGVAELDFTNRSGPPARRQIIEQRTILPDALEEPELVRFALGAKTADDWPLLLLPTEAGLQVWQHQQTWQPAVVLSGALETHLRPSMTNEGYTQRWDLDLGLTDVNGDGRDDLMTRRSLPGGKQIHSLFLQTSNGLFPPNPTLVYTNEATDLDTELYWIDLNRDGKLDLVKSTLMKEPFFLPGIRSGKVLVTVYLADSEGRLPARPNYVFRKDDWSPALPVLDVDGDGFIDLVMGYIPLVNREGLRKRFTTQTIDLVLKFYFCRPSGGFLKEPDFQHTASIHFDPEYFFSLEEHPYYEQFVNLTGDFNGDGKRDLAVRDRTREIGVWFFGSREKGFRAEADLRFECPEPISSWEIRDLNGDGMSDLIVHLGNTFRFYLSQRQ